MVKNRTYSVHCTPNRSKFLVKSIMKFLAFLEGRRVHQEYQSTLNKRVPIYEGNRILKYWQVVPKHRTILWTDMNEHSYFQFQT